MPIITLECRGTLITTSLDSFPSESPLKKAINSEWKQSDQFHLDFSAKVVNQFLDYLHHGVEPKVALSGFQQLFSYLLPGIECQIVQKEDVLNMDCETMRKFKVRKIYKLIKEELLMLDYVTHKDLNLLGYTCTDETIIKLALGRLKIEDFHTYINSYNGLEFGAGIKKKDVG